MTDGVGPRLIVRRIGGVSPSSVLPVFAASMYQYGRTDVTDAFMNSRRKNELLMLAP
jgi:hypothetical protein